MPTRSIDINGRTWRVFPSGRVTQFERDEFGVIFVHGAGSDRVVRVARYTPNGIRSRERSLADMSDADLRWLLQHSQPSETSPEADYSA